MSRDQCQKQFLLYVTVYNDLTVEQRASIQGKRLYRRMKAVNTRLLRQP